MRREYIYLILGLVIIVILGILLFLPTETIRKPSISEEATNTSINK